MFPMIEPFEPARRMPGHLALVWTAIQSFQLVPHELAPPIESYPYSTTWDAWASDFRRMRVDSDRALVRLGAVRDHSNSLVSPGE